MIPQIPYRYSRPTLISVNWSTYPASSKPWCSLGPHSWLLQRRFLLPLSSQPRCTPPHTASVWYVIKTSSHKAYVLHYIYTTICNISLKLSIQQLILWQCDLIQKPNKPTPVSLKHSPIPIHVAVLWLSIICLGLCNICLQHYKHQTRVWGWAAVGGGGGGGVSLIQYTTNPCIFILWIFVLYC